jgi:nucleoside-diphosphate-sugar epimerase
MKKQKFYYLAVTNDEYEFPLVSAETYDELAKFMNRSVIFLKKAFDRCSTDRECKCKYIRVPIEDENSIYQQKGYASREDYLNYLAQSYGLSKVLVETLAKSLGEKEDFNQLIIMLKEIKKA